jgi:hypothetical protein
MRDRAKRQMSADHVEAGRYSESDIDASRNTPWKIKNRFSNCFTDAQTKEYDAAFFQVNGKPLRLTVIPHSGPLHMFRT